MCGRGKEAGGLRLGRQRDMVAIGGTSKGKFRMEAT